MLNTGHFTFDTFCLQLLGAVDNKFSGDGSWLQWNAHTALPSFPGTGSVSMTLLLAVPPNMCIIVFTEQMHSYNHGMSAVKPRHTDVIS